MKSELKRIIYDKVRKDALKCEFKKYGRVEEIDDLIICYVEQRNIDKILKAYAPSTWTRRLYFSGKPVNDEQQKLYDVFKFNKPVVYVFDGITFNFKPEIFAGNTGVIFKNCQFNLGIEIRGNSLIKFINNKYYGMNSMGMLNSISCEGSSITFENEFINRLTLNHFNNGLDNCMECESNRFICIDTDNLIINNSMFYTEQFHVNAKNINISNSKIESSIDAIITNENRNVEIVEYTNSPIVFYNNRLVSNDNLDRTSDIEDTNILKQILIDMIEDARYYGFNKREEKKKIVINRFINKDSQKKIKKSINKNGYKLKK